MNAIEPSRDQIALLNTITPVSRETIQRFVTFNKLLRSWQSKTNLVSNSTLDAFWERHVADSLQVFALATSSLNWIDLGSGGGFPGLIIAMLVDQTYPDKSGHVALVESIGKKCAFLRRVSIETGTPVTIHQARIESVSEQISQADVITARALAPISKLLDLVGDQLIPGKRALFHKGREYRQELEDCRGKWRFDLVVHPSRIDGDSVILEISSAERESG